MSIIEATLIVKGLLVKPNSKGQLQKMFPQLLPSQIQVIWESLSLLSEMTLKLSESFIWFFYYVPQKIIHPRSRLSSD